MVGDLPNLQLSASGLTGYSASAIGGSLTAGPGALLDADGAALVVTADQDDGQTQPEGNSGARIACGVIAARGQTAPAAAPAAKPASLPTPTAATKPAAPNVPAVVKPAAKPTVAAAAKPPVAVAKPTTAAAAAAAQGTTPAPTSSSAPPAFLVAGLGVLLLGAGFALGRLRRRPG
jgi:hypothetical protein